MSDLRRRGRAAAKQFRRVRHPMAVLSVSDARGRIRAVPPWLQPMIVDLDVGVERDGFRTIAAAALGMAVGRGAGATAFHFMMAF